MEGRCRRGGTHVSPIVGRKEINFGSVFDLPTSRPSSVARTLSAGDWKRFRRRCPPKHSFGLLGQEQKGPHGNAAKLTAFPMCSHDAVNGMGI